MEKLAGIGGLFCCVQIGADIHCNRTELSLCHEQSRTSHLPTVGCASDESLAIGGGLKVLLMIDTTNVILQRAYELIEKDDLEQARSILTPLLENDAENPSLWWVYSHSLRDRSIGQLALDRVIELDPSYPGAAELRAEVVQLQEKEDDLLGVATITDGSAQSETDLNVDEWEALQPVPDAEDGSAGGRRGFVLLIVTLLIIAAGAALIASGALNLSDLLSGLLPTPEPAVIVVSEPTEAPAKAEAVIVATGTLLESAASELSSTAAPEANEIESAAEATTEAIASVVPATTAVASPEVASEAEGELPLVEPTMESISTEPDQPNLIVDEPETPLQMFASAVATRVSEFEFSLDAGRLEATALGETLVLQFCAIPGREFNERLNRVMHALVELHDSIPEDIEAVAAGLLNCSDPDASLRVIGVSVDVIVDFANEATDDKDFQRAWQPLS